MPLHQLGIDLFEACFHRCVLLRLEAEEIPGELGQGVILENPAICGAASPLGLADEEAFRCVR